MVWVWADIVDVGNDLQHNSILRSCSHLEKATNP